MKILLITFVLGIGLFTGSAYAVTVVNGSMNSAGSPDVQSFNSVLPDEFPFVNEPIDKGKLNEIVSELINKYGILNITPILDRIKNFGFKYATRSGVTWGLDDITVPEEKAGIVEKARKQVKEINGSDERKSRKFNRFIGKYKRNDRRS